MKKTGILNAQLLCELTKLRHQDKLVICDVGFPLPPNANVVDVSLVAGIPTFPQVLKAVADELIFEKYVIFASMREKNGEYYQLVSEAFQAQEHEEVTFPEFKAQAADAKLFIRTGETRSASNILLVSASGVPHVCEKYDVTIL